MAGTKPIGAAAIRSLAESMGKGAGSAEEARGASSSRRVLSISRRSRASWRLSWLKMRESARYPAAAASPLSVSGSRGPNSASTESRCSGGAPDVHSGFERDDALETPLRVVESCDQFGGFGGRGERSAREMRAEACGSLVAFAGDDGGSA